MAHIYIYSPSSAVRDRAAFRRGLRRLAALGHTVEVDAAALTHHMRFAGDDATRLAAIGRAAASGADVALISRGGYGLTRLLPDLPYKALARAAQRGTRFVGLSDFTALQNALLARTGAITWAGPALGEDFGSLAEPDEIMQACFDDLLAGQGEGTGWRLPAPRKAAAAPAPQSLAPQPPRRRAATATATAPSGVAAPNGGPTPSESLSNAIKKRAKTPINTCRSPVFLPPKTIHNATLWGGNLTVLTSLLGTPYWPDVRRGVLFLEDVHEPPWRIERMLTQLLHAGVLARQQAVLLGQFTGYKLIKGYDRGFGLPSVVQRLQSQLKAPVLSGLPHGHVPTKVLLPVGAKVDLAVDGRDALLVWGHL